MMVTIVGVAVIVLYFVGLLTFCAWAQRKVPPWAYALGWAAWCTFWFVWDVFDRDQVGMALNALIGSYWWHDFWRKKPPVDRDKVKKAIGAKAKALKAKLVASMPQASPVSQPVPVGV